MNKTEGKKRVALYIRVSSDEQAKEGLSLAAQRKKLEEYCSFKDYYVYKIYADEGISGKSMKNRSGFLSLISDAKDKKFSAVVVYKFDRAWRSSKDAINTLDDFKEIGVDFISVMESIDTTTPMGKVFFTIIAAFAELERENTAERLDLIRQAKFDEGKMVSRAPYGYRMNKASKKMQIKASEQGIVKNIYSLRSEGKSVQEIAKIVGLSHPSVGNILKNKVYCGYVSYKGETKKGIHKPIISEALWERVQ